MLNKFFWIKKKRRTEQLATSNTIWDDGDAWDNAVGGAKKKTKTGADGARNCIILLAFFGSPDKVSPKDIWKKRIVWLNWICFVVVAVAAIAVPVYLAGLLLVMCWLNTWLNRSIFLCCFVACNFGFDKNLDFLQFFVCCPEKKTKLFEFKQYNSTNMQRIIFSNQSLTKWHDNSAE